MRSVSDHATAAVPAPVQRMADVLVQAIHPEAIVLFGSQLKGSATEKSDVDLLVVWDTPLPPALRHTEVAPLLHELGVRVDLLLRTPAEVRDLAARRHSFVHSVLRWGLVIYESAQYRLPSPIGADVE